MKYTKEERLNIGERIFKGEFTTSQAAKEFDINYYTAREYLRSYKAEMGINKPAKINTDNIVLDYDDMNDLDYSLMTREELLEELMVSKINEQRLILGLEYTRKPKGKFEIIDHLSQQFSVMNLCKALNVSRSGYYKWRNKQSK